MRICDTALLSSFARRDADRTKNEWMHSVSRLDGTSTSLTLPHSGAQMAGEHSHACARVHGSSEEERVGRRNRREDRSKKKKRNVFFFCVCVCSNLVFAADPLPSKLPPHLSKLSLPPSLSPLTTTNTCRLPLSFHRNRFFHYFQSGKKKSTIRFFYFSLFLLTITIKNLKRP